MQDLLIREIRWKRNGSTACSCADTSSKMTKIEKREMVEKFIEKKLKLKVEYRRNGVIEWYTN